MRNLDNSKKIVIKIGTSSLTTDSGKLNLIKIENLAKIICELAKNNIKIVLVSSGAISAGVEKLNLENRPTEIATKQAVACVGQNALMQAYNNSFIKFNYDIGQMLLSKYIFDHEQFLENAKNCINKLWQLNCIPIINENDSITVDEIKMGDNDNLSFCVANMVKADLLIILSDIDGVYDSNPKTNSNAKIIHTIKFEDDILNKIEMSTINKFGIGGIETKILCGLNCAKNNIDEVIINSENLDNIYKVLDNEEIGTYFPNATKKQL